VSVVVHLIFDKVLNCRRVTPFKFVWIRIRNR